MTLVALSAAYGAGGSRVGPAVADRLDVPFVDRALPLNVAEGLDFPEDESVQASWLERVLRGFVGAESSVSGPVATSAAGEAEYRRASEDLLHRQAASGQGVILGRAAVVVLRDDPRVLRVRLDGPPERRIEQAVHRFGADPDAAARTVRKLDRAHDSYLKHFYGEDISDPSLYHLMIDSTVLPIETCAELIVMAARSRRRAAEAAARL